jgi:hypothetical protein
MLTLGRTAGNATGNRPGGPTDNDAVSGLTKAVPGGAPVATSAVGGDPTKDKDANAGFGLENFEKDVKGSLKVHIKLDLDVDIHITARIKGDIAIGLL